MRYLSGISFYLLLLIVCPIIAMEEKIETGRIKVHALIADYYKKNQLPSDRNQTKITSQRKPKDPTLWQKVLPHYPSGGHGWVKTNKNLLWIVAHEKQQNSPTDAPHFAYIYSKHEAELGIFIFDHPYATFSDDGTKLITLENATSPEQTEWDLTQLYADIKAIDTMPEEKVKELISLQRELDDTIQETKVKKFMDNFLKSVTK